MLRSYLRSLSLIICCLVMLPLAMADDSSPQAMLRQVTDSMIARLNADKERIKIEPGHVFRLVEEILVPNADFKEMSKRVLAIYWRRATPTQRLAFTEQFKILVIHTYATAFRRYKDEQVVITGQRTGRSNKNLVEVKSKIKQTEGPDIEVNYRMIKRASGWKVYDMNVEGVSLVSSFRSQFADKLRSSGIDAVITDLAKKNLEEEEKQAKKDKG